METIGACVVHDCFMFAFSVFAGFGMEEPYSEVRDLGCSSIDLWTLHPMHMTKILRRVTVKNTAVYELHEFSVFYTEKDLSHRFLFY